MFDLEFSLKSYWEAIENRKDGCGQLKIIWLILCWGFPPPHHLCIFRIRLSPKTKEGP